MQTVKHKQRFEDGCLCGAVRFVATGQIGYLSLGDRDGL